MVGSGGVNAVRLPRQQRPQLENTILSELKVEAVIQMFLIYYFPRMTFAIQRGCCVKGSISIGSLKMSLDLFYQPSILLDNVVAYRVLATMLVFDNPWSTNKTLTVLKVNCLINTS